MPAKFELNREQFLSQINEEIQDAIKGAMGDLAVATLHYVQIHTPVDTGRAQRSWDAEMTEYGFILDNPVDYITLIKNDEYQRRLQSLQDWIEYHAGEL